MRTKDLIRTPDLNLAFPSAGRRRPYSRQARHARCLPFRVGRLRPFFSPRRAGLRRAHAGGGGGGGRLTELRAGSHTSRDRTPRVRPPPLPPLSSGTQTHFPSSQRWSSWPRKHCKRAPREQEDAGGRRQRRSRLGLGTSTSGEESTQTCSGGRCARSAARSSARASLRCRVVGAGLSMASRSFCAINPS